MNFLLLFLIISEFFFTFQLRSEVYSTTNKYGCSYLNEDDLLLN